MTSDQEGLLVRFVGLAGLFFGISGLLSTAMTLIRLLGQGGLPWVIAVSGVFGFAVFLLLANLLDVVAYVALLIVAVRLIKLQSSARTAGLVLGCYFVFMAVAQPVSEYVFFYRPLFALRRQPVDAVGFLPMFLGAWLLLVYGLALVAVMYVWGRARPRPRQARRVAATAASTGAAPPPRVRSGSRVATNAPRDWPPVHVDQWVPSIPLQGHLAVLAALAGGFKERGRDVRLSLMRSLLYDDGVVRIPMMLEEGSQRTAVFVYADATDESAAHYSAARALLRQREGMSAVYYAPEPLLPRPAGQVVEALDPSQFSMPERERPASEYALWWPTSEEPLLRDSPVLPSLDTWFESLDGFAYVLFSSFGRVLELWQEDSQVYGLPVQPLMVPVDGPNDLALYLHAAQDEGLWLAFDVEHTSAVLRNRLLGQLAALARNVRVAIDASGSLPSRREEEAHALYFWRRARQQALDAEGAGAAGLRIGSILEAGSARVSLPGASSAGERQALTAGATPSEALTGFAAAQLDHAIGLLKRPPDEPRPPGQPNLHPFVTVRRGGDVFRVTLPQFEEPEARSMCPFVVAEYAGFDAVALVCDGIVTMDEERFDGIIVHGQEPDDPGCHVFTQRYRLSQGRLELLGNWMLSGRQDSLLPAPAAEPPRREPGPAVEAFLAEMVEATLQWIRTGDGSGAELYEAAGPLFSPALHVRAGAETQMHRFVMGNLLWAQGAALDVLAERPQARLAALVYDWVAERNGQPARSLRFHVHERGAPASWLFALPYAVPVPGRRFEAAGPPAVVRAGRPLLPD